MPLHDRSFDLVLLSNWEDQIVYESDNVGAYAGRIVTPETNLTTPANKALESGSWTQSIIWGPNAPFKDFTQLEFNHEDDIVPEEKTSGCAYLHEIIIFLTRQCSRYVSAKKETSVRCRSSSG